MLYFLQAIAEVCFKIIVYITNPIVVLFADEVGQLPNGLLKLWQTHDNPLDIEWMVTEHNVPKFAEYDFNRHYKYHEESTDPDGTLHPGWVDLLDPNFTRWERFQRYICRVRWVYRNSGYGFSYFVNGRTIKPEDRMVVVKDINEENPHREFLFAYTKRGNIITKTWTLFIYWPWCKWLNWRIYLGWKVGKGRLGRHMLALHINPFRTSR